jgi:hypothetical protein
MRPAVIHKVSELPSDPDRAGATLDASVAQPNAEQHAKLTPRQKQIETHAAFAAAVIGSLFSKTKNVGFGMATTMDENRIGGPKKKQPKHDPDQDADDAPPPAPEPVTAVPWLRLQ